MRRLPVTLAVEYTSLRVEDCFLRPAGFRAIRENRTSDEYPDTDIPNDTAA
jgi:hypothetical protein